MSAELGQVRVRTTVSALADRREIIYFDRPDAPERTAVDTRDLPVSHPMSQIRRDPLTGEWVVIAAHRQDRTYQPPVSLCPLCPSAPGRPTEIPESHYQVVAFENRFPSFAAGTPPTESTVDGIGLAPLAPGRGRCDVVCFTDDHDSSFGQLPPWRSRLVVDALAERTAALSALPGVAQVYPFENRGEQIGVTLSHPHGQIYGYPFVTPRTTAMLRSFAEHRLRTGRHLMTDLLKAERGGSRIVLAGQRWTAMVPIAARWPVEVLLTPHRQLPDLTACDDEERDELATMWPELVRRFDRLHGHPLPYIAAWHQAPVRAEGRDLGWLHLQLFSIARTADKLKYLAGSESGMAVWISDVTPEQTAQRLREVAD
jgi:UDPglucose--hexose-1-phosphate uridylyltransferase